MADKFLGTLKGRGMLHDPTHGSTEVDYEISVIERDGLRDGEGTMRGNIAFFDLTLESNDLVLKMADGSDLRVVLTDFYLSEEGVANFNTTGTIPSV